MCKSHDQGSKFVEGEAFLVKNDLFDPSDHYMTFDPLLVMWHNFPKVRVIVTKFGRNQSRNVEVISRRSVARRRKKHELDIAVSSRWHGPCRCLFFFPEGQMTWLTFDFVPLIEGLNADERTQIPVDNFACLSKPTLALVVLQLRYCLNMTFLTFGPQL